MELILQLAKECTRVDKYELVDAQGNVITKTPTIGPIYIDKQIVKGAKRIKLVVAAC